MHLDVENYRKINCSQIDCSHCFPLRGHVKTFYSSCLHYAGSGECTASFSVMTFLAEKSWHMQLGMQWKGDKGRKCVTK